jgi:N-acetylglutamate synthase-like GNAT family acetyltransferase
VIAVRSLQETELGRIADIDRSEHVTVGYQVRDGRLTAEAVDWCVPRWPPTGGKWSVEARVRRMAELLQEGGEVVGAFEANRLVGVAALRHRLTRRLAQLTAIFVSRESRRRGIASRLLAEATRLAKADGAEGLYVSAVPSESAVGFYTSRGFRPIEKPNPELLAREPDDIHMVLDLSPDRPGGS